MTAARSWAANQSSEIAFVFVYGGLMRGFDLHHYMAGFTFVGEGQIKGLLVALGRYPGLIDGDGKVSGEVYKLSDAPAGLEALDDLEDFDPGDPQGSAYVRIIRDVSLRDGSKASAWAYLYNRDASGMPLIKSGDWHCR